MKLRNLLCLSEFGVIILTTLLVNSTTIGEDEQTHLERTKRFVWMKDRKLILPPGSILTITPTFQIPFLRQPPEGLNSDIKLSWVFYMFFDKLGMTDDSHPWPPFYPFSDLFRITRRKKYKRSVLSFPPPERIHGGERAVMIPQIEKLLESFGVTGRACLLRAVCEIHEFPLHEHGFGLVGEILTLVFTVSKSPYAESHLYEYLKAEEAGRAGDCGRYVTECSKSMFVWEEKSSYRRLMERVEHPHSHKQEKFDSLTSDNLM